MSKSRKLQLHIGHLEEIRTILNSMKNLAVTETHKLSRFLTAQTMAVAHIERVALDFLSFYPEMSPAAGNAERTGIMLGSERGFCGDFNERLIDFADKENFTRIIAIGSRLSTRVDNSLGKVITKLSGATVTEEVSSILDRLIESLGALHHPQKTVSLAVVYHDDNAKCIVRRQLLPPFLELEERSLGQGSPPLLNLRPEAFYEELVDQYLFAVLHNVFFHSLMAENQRRLQHLEGAVKHLDDETVSLHRKFQIFRQEEITEEIEVILLNADL